MARFIFSEVMFFFAFFFALAYVRNFAVPWLGGEGEKGIANMLWPGFEATWPVMITPDQAIQGSEFLGPQRRQEGLIETRRETLHVGRMVSSS